MRIERLLDLPAARLAPLIAESEQAGLRFVSRLAAEWASGRNRFDRPGEALFGALTDGCLGGVCGLNVDPYAGAPRIGLATLRLSTANPQAAGLYEALGFRRRAGDARCTHVMEIAAVP